MSSQSGGGLVNWPTPIDLGSGPSVPGGGGGSSNWPLHDTRIELDESLTIPEDYQYLIWQRMEIEGRITIEEDGHLVVLSEGVPEPTGPDMSYVNGDLTQIDYDKGEQRLFSYTSGDLTRVDFLQDGTTLRKDLVYSSGTLDYINEYYVD